MSFLYTPSSKILQGTSSGKRGLERGALGYSPGLARPAHGSGSEFGLSSPLPPVRAQGCFQVGTISNCVSGPQMRGRSGDLETFSAKGPLIFPFPPTDQLWNTGRNSQGQTSEMAPSLPPWIVSAMVPHSVAKVAPFRDSSQEGEICSIGRDVARPKQQLLWVN
jgi:hypothetical protein